MAVFSLYNLTLRSVASTVPMDKISNRSLTFDDFNAELFIKTTGIETRRISAGKVTAADLCIQSAEKILREEKIDKSGIDILVMVTQTPDHLIPGSSMFIQEKMGLSKNCICFDINQGCAGYVYGLSVIGSFMSSAKLRKGLLLVGDTITQAIDPNDSSLVPIFSDAGSATLIEYDENAKPWHFNLQTDGSGYNKIFIESGGARMHKEDGNSCLYMNGQDIFNFGLTEIPANIKELLKYAEVSSETVDYFIMHQANLLLNETIRKKAEIHASVTLYSLQNYGNTSCATIPVTLSEHADKLNHSSVSLLLSGFGVGLSWGSCILPVENFNCYPVAEFR